MSTPTPQEISKELNDFLLKFSSTKHLYKGLDNVLDALILKDSKLQDELDILEKKIENIKEQELENKKNYDNSIIEYDKEVETKRTLTNDIVKIRKKLQAATKEVKFLDAEFSKANMQVDLNLEALVISENNLNANRERFNAADQQRAYYESLAKTESVKLAQTSENVTYIKNTQQEFQQSLAKALSTSLDVTGNNTKSTASLPSLNKSQSSSKLQKPNSLVHSSSTPDIPASTSLSPQAKTVKKPTSVMGEKKLPPIKSP